MRILHTPVPKSPAGENFRVEPLLEKIRVLEERLRILEQARKQEKPAAPLAKMTLDADTVHKPLLNKMWKYLHDDPSAKTI